MSVCRGVFVSEVKNKLYSIYFPFVALRCVLKVIGTEVLKCFVNQLTIMLISIYNCENLCIKPREYSRDSVFLARTVNKVIKARRFRNNEA